MSFASNAQFSAPDNDPGHVAVVSRDTVSSKTGAGKIWVIGENQETYSKGYTDGESPAMIVKDWQIKSFDSHPDIEWFAPPSSPPSLAVLQGSDTGAGQGFGAWVAISGTTAVVGAPGHAKADGRAYVFTETATGWTQAKELVGSNIVARYEFGDSVAISGTTVAWGLSRSACSRKRLEAGPRWPS
jgi:hypothetical protein